MIATSGVIRCGQLQGSLNSVLVSIYSWLYFYVCLLCVHKVNKFAVAAAYVHLDDLIHTAVMTFAALPNADMKKHAFRCVVTSWTMMSSRVTSHAYDVIFAAPHRHDVISCDVTPLWCHFCNVTWPWCHFVWRHFVWRHAPMMSFLWWLISLTAIFLLKI